MKAFHICKQHINSLTVVTIINLTAASAYSTTEDINAFIGVAILIPTPAYVYTTEHINAFTVVSIINLTTVVLW